MIDDGTSVSGSPRYAPNATSACPRLPAPPGSARAHSPNSKRDNATRPSTRSMPWQARSACH
ncbi:Uncharacterised protein [Mycobacteroides abscessus subsp. abscessus]|nr:Uncharacterised protein [Mycobacteroides abscessus subsp. abscessus]